MRLHIICGALLISLCAFAQQKQQTVKLKVPPLPPSTEDSLTAQLADARWVPAEKLVPKMPPGAEIALIGADPVSTGPTIYLRMKPGYKLPRHWHIHLETSIMISGKGQWTVAGRKVPASPGTFVIVASKAPSEFSCDAGAPCVFVVRRSGPTDFNLDGK